MQVDEYFSDMAARYQKQVTGYSRGWAYVVNGVKFDGFKGGVLLDAKGLGYAKLMSDPSACFSLAENILSTAERQLAAAGGTPIRWIVAEEEFAQGLMSLFQSNGININVLWVPFKF